MTDRSARGAVLTQRLQDMHDTLRGMLVVIRSVADERDGDFGDPSPARREWTSTPARVGSDLQEAYKTGMVTWHAVIDYGHSLADLIGTRRTYGAMTVARSLAEAAVRSWHHMEEGITVRVRIERMLNERLYANRENQALLRGLLPQGASTPGTGATALSKEPLIKQRIERGKAELTELQACASRNKIPYLKKKGWREAQFGDGRVNAMTLLRGILEHPPQGDSFYRTNSAVVHSSLHGLGRMIYLAEHEDGRLSSKPLPMHPDDLCAQAWPGVAAAAIAAVTLFKQAGWPGEALDAATDKLMAAWNPPTDEVLLQGHEALS